MATARCVVCGVEWSRLRMRGNHRKTCSEECRAEWRRRRVAACAALERAKAARRAAMCTAPCAVCGKDFLVGADYRKRCCSDACSSEHRRRSGRGKYVRVSYPPSVCGHCGKAFSPKAKNSLHCSDRCRARARDKRRGGGHMHRARNLGVAYELVDRMAVFERDGWRCQICGKRTPKARNGTRYPNAPELDHRVPVTQLGPHTYENVQCACHACNQAKGNRRATGQVPLWARPDGRNRRG